MEGLRLQIYRLEPRSGFKYGVQAYDVFVHEEGEKRLVASFSSQAYAQEYVNFKNYQTQKEEK